MYDVAFIQREMAKQFLSVRKLAQKSKVSEPTISRVFKTGAGNPETIGKIVRALKLKPEDVVLMPTEITVPVDLPTPLTRTAEQELAFSAKENRQ